MRIPTKLLCAAALIASAGNAMADNWYAGASGDASWLTDSANGAGGNLDLGYRFKPGTYGDFRAEGEFGYHDAHGGDDGNSHYFTYMGNVYYDFNYFNPSDTNWKVAPYIGAGLGDADIHGGSADGNRFAYEGMAGLTFTPAGSNMDLTLGYRYLGTDEHNINSNNAEIGLRFHF